MFNDLVTGASIVDWILLATLLFGLVMRGLEWHWKQSRIADESANYVTRKELQNELELSRLKHDDEVKHWVSTALSAYCHVKQADELSRRIERLEDKS